MMLPEDITDYLRSIQGQKGQPICFLVDSEYRLCEIWGDRNDTAFQDLDIGDSTLDTAPFLVGSMTDHTEVLPFVGTRDGKIFEVHIIPKAKEHLVLLINVTEAHDALQVHQQTANELKLLHAEQNQLVARQRELISDLIEAKSELDHCRHEAEQNVEKKNEFIAMISHDFRTPLSAIINYTEMLLATPDEVDLAKCGEAIKRASRHLSSLVETILDDAQAQAKNQQAKSSAFDIRSLADDLAAVMAPLAAEKGLAFAVHVEARVPDTLLSDSIFLRQIFINLLGNAVKFTDTGAVTLKIDWSGNWLYAEVEDTGPGISANDKERVFQAFERGIGTDSRTPGAGLGLAISLNLARLMGGKIDLESELGKGCKANLSLPAPRAKKLNLTRSEEPSALAALNSNEAHTILVCDDDEDMLELYEHYFLKSGYIMLVAKDGQEAVKMASSCSPDLILLDICTPRMNGFEAAEALSAQGFSKPILAVTAMNMELQDTSHFSACLRKPFQINELLALVKLHTDQSS